MVAAHQLQRPFHGKGAAAAAVAVAAAAHPRGDVDRCLAVLAQAAGDFLALCHLRHDDHCPHLRVAEKGDAFRTLQDLRRRCQGSAAEDPA